MTPAEMVEKYIKLRDKKKALDDAHKKSMAPFNECMEKLEGLLLIHLQEAGTDSASCAAGTVYKRIETNITVEDKVAFDAWVMDQPSNEQLDVKPNKTAIKAMLEEGREPPPGVKVTQVALVGVQRK